MNRLRSWFTGIKRNPALLNLYTALATLAAISAAISEVEDKGLQSKGVNVKKHKKGWRIITFNCGDKISIKVVLKQVFFNQPNNSTQLLGNGPTILLLKEVVISHPDQQIPLFSGKQLKTPQPITTDDPQLEEDLQKAVKSALGLFSPKKRPAGEYPSP